MKTFNIITAIVFGLLAIVCLWAGFSNPFHFISAGCSILLTTLALLDDSDGESIIDHYKNS